MAKHSARTESLATSSVLRPVLAVMISGFSARAMMLAASSMACVSGNGGDGVRRRDGEVYSQPFYGPASTSRGSVR